MLLKYARLRPSGRPIRCTPPKKIRNQRIRMQLKPLKRKYIFDSVEIANEYVEKITELGASPCRVYVCPYSGTGHAHVTGNLIDRGY